MRSSACAAVLAFGLLAASSFAEVTLDLTAMRLTLDDRGAVAALKFADGAAWPGADQPVMALQTDRGTLLPESVRWAEGRLHVVFDEGIAAEFTVVQQPGVAVFRLVRLDRGKSAAEIEQFHLFRLPVPAGAQRGGILNSAASGPWAVAVMAAEPNVEAASEQTGGVRGDRPGCKHEFVQNGEAKAGRFSARFTATCNAQPGGWSVQGKSFPRPLDLRGCKAVRAWVRGDGKGEHLKIQLFDGRGGYRDVYLPIDFTGWRQVTIAESPFNNLRYDRVSGLNFYYNSIPAGQTVDCLIDQVEAIVQRDGKEQVVLLEDFESRTSPLWMSPVTTLGVQTLKRHGLEPAAFGIIACPKAEFLDTVERFERAAGVPSPRLGGVWNKRSPWIKRSYFFLTDFREPQFDEALAIARRGGFDLILLGQESWCRSTGHYEVNTDRFPDGLEGLKRTVERFKREGFKVGLHFLGPSIYPPDRYLTPVPDPRLVKGAATTLAAAIDTKAEFLPTPAAPEAFPKEDGGYEGDGTVLQVGDELIWYGERSMQPPFGFARCRRGHLGTKPAAHQPGEKVSHLVRSYGYHMFDMDTTLLDEVTTNFAKVANACRIDMIYFDGSERLQGDHWYYNARLQKAFYDKLANKDTLLQGSSYSHYSWHLMARSASADGHGDLKGYLDERSPWFDSFGRDGMPLDIGWYYGYDPSASLDMYEYVLGATIGYDSSMSFQVSVGAAARHPFTGQILDLISRYEKLRLSGRVPPEMKARLRIDPVLGGQKTPEERTKLLDHRRDYRLLGPEGKEVFQRVVYEPWQEVQSPDGKESGWTVRIKDGPARVGAQVHAQAGPWLAPGPAYRSSDALVLETFDDPGRYSGSTSPGVTQRFEGREDGAREGKRYAVYTAQSTQPDASGWSHLGKTFDPPLDISWHRGIGLWLRGDGKGGAFKLQLTDGRGATDYYITNDYTGWRYQQLARPAKDPIDYARVRTLGLYYNGLPAKTTVSCGIDDVKALRALDRQAIVDPWVEVGGKRLAWKGTLTEGQYLVFWPGEPITRFGPPLKEPEHSAVLESLTLPPGEYPVRFGSAGAPGMSVRARVSLQPPERHEVP